MLQQNFAYILAKKALLHPAHVAIVEPYNSKSYTYADLLHRCNRLANAFKAAGIERGDRICCLTTNSVEYIDIFMATARIGAILCPLNYRLAPVEIIKILQDAQPKAFLFDSEFEESAREIAAAIDSIRLCLYFGSSDISWANTLEKEMAQHLSSGPPIEGDSEDTLLLLYTAGSTGRPKGVPLKQTNLFFNAVNWIIDVGITKNDYTLTVIPLFHIGGHMLWTLPHLIVGARVMLQRRFTPEETLANISKSGVTNTYFIPAMAKMILALSNWKKHDFSKVRFIGAGGEAVPERITREFGELGVPILNSYGLTETSDGTIGIRPFDEVDKATNCIGKPLTLTDAMVISADGSEAAVGQEGELVHRGPSVVDAYWKRPEESDKTFRDGWLHTGDMAMKDSDGFYYFLGRKDDMIVSGGENVYPAEVEEAILSHEKVADVAVLGIPDEKWGQTIKAIIAAKKNSVISEKEIAEHLKKKLSRFKQPRIIEFVPSLPKIGSGKLDRTLIKKQHGNK